MLNVVDFISDDLPPTLTYGKRSYCWIPDDGTGDVLGELILKVQPAKTGWGRKIEVDTYLVERDTEEPGDHGGRAYWLVNISDPEQEQPYRCLVGGLNPKCGCKAGQCKVPEPCKHLAALSALVEFI